MAHKKLICPECKKESVIPIVYGYPSQEMLEEASKNEYLLGGCIVEESNPEFYCTSCKKQW